MARKKLWNRLISTSLCAVMTAGLVTTGAYADGFGTAASADLANEVDENLTATTDSVATLSKDVADMMIEDYQNIISSYTIDKSIPNYKNYLSENSSQSKADAEVEIFGKDYTRFSDGKKGADGNYTYGTATILTNYKDSVGNTVEGDSVLTTEGGLIEWSFDVEKSGYYSLEMLYCHTNEDSKRAAAQRTFFIDGKLPYQEMALVDFERIYKMDITESKTDAKGNVLMSWRKDNQGNDLKPSMVESFQWTTKYAFDSDGYTTDPLMVYLEAGSHTLTVVSTKEPLIINKITFKNDAALPTYKEYLAEKDSEGAKMTSNQAIVIEAENIAFSSSASLYPKQDQTSPEVYPVSSKELLNNSIGGTSWNDAGEWIEYTFEVPEDGYYNMSMYVKQNFVKGVSVSRKITIDGVIPFEELAAYGFQYEQGWRTETLGNEEGNFKIYLTKGTHTLRMEDVLGEFGEIIGQVEECVTELNAIYRSVIQLIGTSPSPDRDYKIKENVKDLVPNMESAKEKLDAAIEHLRAVAGKGSDKEATLVTMSDDLKVLIHDPEKFTKILGTYKSDMRACGTWLTTVINQPLQVDVVEFTSDNKKPDRKVANIFASAWFEITRLYWSFFIDYNQLGNTAEAGSGETLTLWVGSGRDQANIIKSLIDETFTGTTGTNVNVMIVDITTLLQATLAGQGPDVAINVPNDYPMNYGTRSAVLDLAQFDDLKSVTSRFDDSAMEAFSYDGSVYALPETQTFPMMFYRKDILEEIGLEVPQTWDDVKVAMTVLSKNQMEVGILAGENIFAMLLFQNGGSYYNDTATRTNLGDDNGINTFKTYCELFTDYGLDKDTSVEERFKTGECPIILSDYTLYNTLQVSAPDIKGLWGVAPVPGVATKDEDGNVTINNVVGGTGTATMIMANTKHPKECWEFLKWWTSTETQVEYSNEMESTLGASARVATANLEAFEMISWPATDMEALMEQHETVRGIPQVPGGYYTWRSVNNAFYTVTTETDTSAPREQIMDAVILINEELDYKRTELHLPTAEDLGLE